MKKTNTRKQKSAVTRRLFFQGGKVRFYLGITVTAGVLLSLLIIVQAHFLSLLIDDVFLKSGSGGWGWLAGLLAVIVGRTALNWTGDTAAAQAAGLVKKSLREAIFKHLLKLGPAYTRGERSGELTNTAMEGVEALDAYYSQYLPQLFLTIVVPLVVVVAVFSADLLSGVVLLVTMPILPIFMILIGLQAQAKSRRQFKILSQMSAHFLDVLQGLTTLKLFGRSQHQAETIARVSERYRERTMGVLRIAFLSSLVMEVGATLSTAIVAVEIGLRLLHGHIPFQSAFFVLLLAPEFYQPLRTVGQRFHASAAGLAAASRIFEILDTPLPEETRPEPEPENAPAHLKAPLKSLKSIGLRFEQVSFAYPTPDGHRTALDGVSLIIEAGGKVALTGPSGAGKSTLAQLLLRFNQPDQGRIYLETGSESIPLNEIPAKGWREMTAWVPQQPYLFNASAAENIRLGKPEASQAEVIAAAKQAYAHEFITGLPQGYLTNLGERGARLSGGQLQRISLARAFLRNAPLLILDEATANLDLENESLILDALDRLMAGKTVLVIAHRAALLERADRVIRLEAGRVVEAALSEEQTPV
jgi:ATP-binding cassette subfamily C protein CydD